MELCEDGHDEVCFDNRECPVCAEKSVNEELLDAVNELDGDGLVPVSDGLDTLADTVKELTPLMGSMDVLLLTLNTCVTQLIPPWHDRESFHTFCDQVGQLDTLLVRVNALVFDKEDLRQWRNAVIATGNQIETVKNACP